MEPPSEAYPVQFSVEYPDRLLNRLTTAFRLIVAIPILIVAGTVGAGWGGSAGSGHGGEVAAGTRGVLFPAPLLMIVFRPKYPRRWVDWDRELLRVSHPGGGHLP